MSQPVLIANGSLGFCFTITANNTGGTNPKSYTALLNGDFLLKGPTSDFAAGSNTGWASDPGDNVFPSTARDYAIALNLAPNNIRLSQVPIFSLTASHGIGRGVGQENLPTSTNFGDAHLNTALVGINANPFPTIGDVGGFSRITVSIISTNAANSVLLNCGILLDANNPRHTFNMANLGLIQIVNLRAVSEVIGVHCEVSA